MIPEPKNDFVSEEGTQESDGVSSAQGTYKPRHNIVYLPTLVRKAIISRSYFACQRIDTE